MALQKLIEVDFRSTSYPKKEIEKSHFQSSVMSLKGYSFPYASWDLLVSFERHSQTLSSMKLINVSRGQYAMTKIIHAFI